MKKCPFCKAEIEENARFCLYCMTPLEEKQTIEKTEGKPRRWVYFLIASALALVVVGALILIIKGTANMQNLSSGISSNIKADYKNQLSALAPNDNSSSNVSSETTADKEPSVTTGDNNSSIFSSLFWYNKCYRFFTITYLCIFCSSHKFSIYSPCQTLL